MNSIRRNIKNLSKKSNFDRDLFFLVILVPAILLLLFLLPPSEKSQFILYKDSPQLLSLFTTHFIHEKADHFLNNATAYIILVIPVYILNLRAGQTKKFYLMISACFFLLPFLLSSVGLLVPTRRTLGFSGIVAAFFGLFPYSVCSYFRRSYHWNANISDVLNLVFLFSVSLIIVSLRKFTFLESTVLIIVLGLFFMYLIKGLRVTPPKVYLPPLKRVFKRNWVVGTFLLTYFIIYLVGLINMFPKVIKLDSTIIGIHTHYVGFVFGFFIPYIFGRKEFRQKAEPRISSHFGRGG